MIKVTFQKKIIMLTKLATNVTEMQPLKSVDLSFSQHETIVLAVRSSTPLTEDLL